MIFDRLKSIATASIVLAGLSLPAMAQQSCGVVVFFNSGQTQPSPEAVLVLQTFAANNAGAPLSVTGYSDAPGSAETNLAISRRRAEAVAAVLGTGVVTRVSGAGEAVRPGTTGPNDPSNRRVEVRNEDCDEGVLVQEDPLGPGLAAGGVGLLAAAIAGLSGSSSGSTGGTGPFTGGVSSD